jgi:hypothetical protein
MPKAGQSSMWSRWGEPSRSLVALAALVSGCAAPVLSRDGQLVLQQKGAHGASVITANGVEFLDKTEIPRPVVRRSADEPWRPATGFLMPADGIWRKTSTPVAVQGHGLAVILRSSDVLIPSWGGEILLRMDAIAPVEAFPRAAASVRAPERITIIVDGAGPDTLALADVVLDNLGGGDRAGVIDASFARPVLPLLPGSHHTLLHAAVERLLAQDNRARPPSGAAHDLTGALALARAWITTGPASDHALRRVIVLTDGAAPGSAPRFTQEAQLLAAAHVELYAVATVEVEALRGVGGARVVLGTLEERKDSLDHMLPPPGEVVLENVRLSTSSVPAPARMIEVSGGDAALGLYADHLSLGEVYAGEARTEVARVALPPWVAGEPLELTVTATYRDIGSGHLEKASATLRCRYSADVEEIARARHGDVLAYASALAMVRRIHRAFLGSEVDRLGGVRRLAALQASSLAELARMQSDRALAVQAEVLQNLLGAIDD